MTEGVQTVVVALIGFAALAYLGRRAWLRLRVRPGTDPAGTCGACDGCRGGRCHAPRR